MTDDNRVLMQLDGRRRLSLGSLATANYYLADAAEDGVITLTPADVVPRTGKDTHEVPGGNPRRDPPRD